MSPTRTYHSALYRDFASIKDRRPGPIIRFFEQHENEIRLLDFDEYFEMLTAYCDALFEAGAYGEHRIVSDEVIAGVIEANIGIYQGKDLFYHTLFRKAASCYHVHRFAEATHILRELIKISPTDALARRFLHRCLFRQYPRWIQGARALAIFLVLWSLLITIVELLWVRTLYLQWVWLFEYVRYGLLAAALLVVAGAFGWHYVRTGWEARAFANEAARRKREARQATEEGR
ncbi:MAG: hypothetical protein D6818_05530 [Bacteroidetes bacterium]|nr:MAG: hypothetical protein D6818_05530 [Bacteroidota bacterium]